MPLLAAPDPSDDAPIVLSAGEPVTNVSADPNSLDNMIGAVPEDRQAEIGQQAKGFVTDLVKFTPKSPEYAQKIQDISTLGSNEILASTAGASRMLEQSGSSVVGAKRNGNTTTQQVAGTLATLRSTVEDLSPNQAELSPVKKILSMIPGGNRLRKYFQKYENAQVQINTIIKSLLAGEDQLNKDNASLTQEKKELWKAMADLNEYAVFAQKMDDEVTATAIALRAAGNHSGADALETDVLFAVRQRRQDILTQLAVSVQGYMAMDLVRKNNTELVKGVERARTTTITALRTAVIVAQALDNQRLVLDQIDAVNTTTNNMIMSTSAMLHQQTARIHQQASSSGVTVDTLSKAFDDIFATLDEVEHFKQQANASMEQTINGLSAQLERAKPQLERVRTIESNEKAKAITK
jgi:uncharacterized protein YaaN involved in tellurite resistance